MASISGIPDDKLPAPGSGLDLSSLSSLESDFVKFFQQAGGKVSSAISLTQLPGQGRCYVANQDIAENEDLFTIPRSVLLNTRNSALPTLCRHWESAHAIKGQHDGEEMDWEGGDKSEESSASPPRVWDELQGWSPLIMCLMWEQWRAGPHSGDSAKQLVAEANTSAAVNWKSYLEIMPNEFSNMPMFWSAQDLAELRGTSVPEKVGREEADAEYSNNVRPYIASHARVFLGPAAEDKSADEISRLIDEHYSLENFHIQGSRILSRSFHVKKEDQAEVKDGQAVAAGDESRDHDNDEEEEDSDEEEDEEEREDTADISMVPMADMLNASYAPENARLFYHTTVLVMRATRSIKRGEQILNTYADPPNADLLRRYGYTDKWNGADDVEIDSSVLVEAIDPAKGAELTARIEHCVELGLEESYVLTSCFPPSETPPHRPEPANPSEKEIRQAMSNFDEELLSAVRVLLLSDDEWESHKAKEKIPKPKLDNVIAAALLKALEKRLESYAGGPTSQPDEDRLYGPSRDQNLSENHRNAIVVRLGEKRVVENNIMVLKRLIEIHKAEEKKKQRPGATKSSSKDAKRKAGHGEAAKAKKSKR